METQPVEHEPQGTELKLVLDVDQVLADMMLGHINAYNTELSLGMTEEEMVYASKKYKQTFDVPPIKTFKEKNPNSFQEARAEILNNEVLHLNFPPIEDSQAGA